MANRSVFPTAVDSFNYLSEVLSSDKVNVERYRTLLMQESRTTEEETELTNLKTTLYNAGKIVTSESFNTIFDCMTNLENFFLNETVPYLDSLEVGALRSDIGFPSNLATVEKTNIVSSINEIYNDKELIKTTYAKKEQMSKFNLTLFNSWVNETGYSAKYWKDEFGVVYVDAFIKGGSTTAFSIISTFAEGYRPLTKIERSALCWTGSGTTFVTARLQVTTAGEIKIIENAGNGWMMLNFSFETF